MASVLDLEGAGRIALKNNPSIQAIQERLIQAGETVKQARAAYAPSLDASGGFATIDNARSSGQADIDGQYKTTLSATWLVFDGFNRELTLQSTREARMGAVEAGNNARRLLLLAVAQNFNTVQLTQEIMATVRADITYYNRQLADARAKREVGTGSLSDVLGIQVLVNGSQAALITAEKESRIALTGLAALLGHGESQLPKGMALSSLEDNLPRNTRLPDLEGLIQEAVHNRPDLKQLNHKLRQAEKNIGMAKSGFYPAVSLNGSWNGEREGNAALETKDFGYAAGISISMNLFSGSLTKSKVAAAQAAVRESELELANQKITIREEVTSAWYELESAARQFDLRKANTDLVRQNRDLVEAEFKAGKNSLVSLTKAQSELIKNRSQYLQAAANFQLALNKIKAYTGDNLLR